MIYRICLALAAAAVLSMPLHAWAQPETQPQATGAAKASANENPCVQQLESAYQAFRDGRIELVQDMLQGCLNQGFTKAQRTEAYRLIALVHLYRNEQAAAQASLRQMLKTSPEYQINTAIDPPEFVQLFNQFRTKPILIVGLHGGVNQTNVLVEKDFSLDNPNLTGRTYTPGYAFEAGLDLELPLFWQWFSIGSGISYVQNGYTYDYTLLDYAQINFREDQVWLEVPLQLRFTFGKNDIRPYFWAGGYVRLLLSATGTVERTDQTITGESRSITSSAIPLDDQRQQLDIHAAAGAGVAWKNLLGRGFLTFELIARYGVNVLTVADKRYQNNSLLFEYGYVDNDIRLLIPSFRIGYRLPLYSPKLLRRYR